MKTKDEEGFSLIEVMVAMAVLAIGILAVAAMQIKSVKGNALANDQARAVALAEERLESLMLIPYIDPSTGVLHTLLADTNGDGLPGLDNDDDGNNDGFVDPNDGSVLYPGWADHADPNNPITGTDHRGAFNVFWNTALPGNNTVNIRVIVTWGRSSDPRRVALDFIKARDV
ncbi:MAG: prepilin-type N-terminal cleavage/methylation domain-containing protein [Thermodesulfobacteriota bacterium]|nr:prepilin-type N-terminal cleavage/methylation domain-containing protein [Thermodesulfobacteriota bacterium]